MNDDTDEPQAPADQGAASAGHRHMQDPLLTVLVQSVDRTRDCEISLTLHVNGLIISGMMCSMVSFFDEQAELIRDLGPAELAQFAEIFDQLARQTGTWLDEHPDECEETADQGAATLRPGLRPEAVAPFRGQYG